MNKEKVYRVVIDLKKRGFDLRTVEFFETTVAKILENYSIDVQLTVDEYFELLRMLMDMCAENDLKDMRIGFLNDDDLSLK